MPGMVKAGAHDPILDGAQIGQPKMLRPDHLVAINFPVELYLLDLRHLAAGKRDVLLQGDRRLSVGEVIVHPVFEHDADKRQAIERSGADDIDAGRGVKSDLDGDCVVALHLLGG